MNLSFFNKKKKEPPPQPVVFIPQPLEIESIDENFFYKQLAAHAVFNESNIICIPHSKTIQGLVITKDIIESHCFIPSPYFCGQYMATKQKQKSIALDKTIITTITGYKEKRTVNILDEETFYTKSKKIKLLLIDRLLEGEPPKYQAYDSITIPAIRNARSDFEFLSLFPENSQAINELQLAVQEFTDTYVYIKGYNRFTVEKIQHIYTKTHQTILQKNTVLQDLCKTPTEYQQFLEIVENVVMCFLHKKIWIQSLQSLLISQDNYLVSICFAYSNLSLSQYPLSKPISDLSRACFEDAILNFQRLDSDHILSEPYKSTLTVAFTPLEKIAVVKSTLDLISSAVQKHCEETLVTSDEMIPLLAYVIVQSSVRRLAGLIYYMQHYRLVRMEEGSMYNFVTITMKSAIEFLKKDPLEQSIFSRNTTHRKSQSMDLQDYQHQHYSTRPQSAILRPHIVIPSSRKSIDTWLLNSSSSTPLPIDPTITQLPSIPLVSSIGDIPKLGRSLSASTVVRKKKLSQPPKEINIRPASVCLDHSEELMGDFLSSLSKLDGNVVGHRKN